MIKEWVACQPTPKGPGHGTLNLSSTCPCWRRDPSVMNPPDGFFVLSRNSTTLSIISLTQGKHIQSWPLGPFENRNLCQDFRSRIVIMRNAGGLVSRLASSSLPFSVKFANYLGIITIVDNLRSCLGWWNESMISWSEAYKLRRWIETCAVSSIARQSGVLPAIIVIPSCCSVLFIFLKYVTQ